MSNINYSVAPQEKYNLSLCKTRAIIERVNGQLKRRFHCLHSELRVEPGRACKVILACVVLFNMSKDFPDFEREVEEEDEDVEQDEEWGGMENGNVVRDTIINNFFS